MKRKIVNIIALVLLIASLIFACIGSVEIIWHNAGSSVPNAYSLTGLQAIMTSPVYYVPIAFIYIVNIGLCVASMLTKSKKKDPVIHVVFPILSFFGIIYFLNICAYSLPTDYIKHNFGSQEYFDRAVESGLVTSYRNTIDDFAMLVLFLFFLFVVLSFIKRSRFIVGLAEEAGLAKEAPVIVQPTQPAAANNNADEIKKYKDLLDSGVITQEEFEAKKKQLLDL